MTRHKVLLYQFSNKRPHWACGLSLSVNFENATGGKAGDSLVGSTADNVLDGGAIKDTLRGGDGNDVLDGGLSNDALAGQSGVDALLGQAGTLIGGFGTGSTNLSVHCRTRMSLVEVGTSLTSDRRNH